MSLKTAATALVAEFSARPTMRAGSLIITIFGDAIAPRGGTVWIGSLIRALEGIGVNERLVRTSVFRLAQDSWLEAQQVGRRSYYSLSAEGRREFETATQRIYGDPRQAWDGEWCLVLLAGLGAEQRDMLRRQLGWSGFGAISTNVLAHPTPDIGELEAVLQRLGVDEDTVVMRGRTIGEQQDGAMRTLVRKSWNLDELDSRYASFVRQFRPVYQALKRGGRTDELLAFQVRTLLIQEYRRILLRDPLLPAELLPAKWNGTAAYQLCRNIYGRIYAAADEFMSSEFETADGPLPPPSPEFYTRFGGLH